MVEIHWAILAVIVVTSFTGGFMLCAILTMASQADDAMEQMRCRKCGELKETDWNMVA